MRSRFLASVNFIEFHTFEAYSSMDPITFRQNISKVSRVKKEQVQFVYSPALFRIAGKYSLYVSGNTFLNPVYPEVFDKVRTGYRRVQYFVSTKRTFVFLVKAVTLVLVLFIFLQLAVHQPYIRSITDCSKKVIVKRIYSTLRF